jgi:cold shock CspA family protein
MLGTIYSIPDSNGKPANWCFITGDDNKEYFLHITELHDKWNLLKAKLAKETSVKVEFEPTMGQKGLRAAGASIVKDEVKEWV